MRLREIGLREKRTTMIASNFGLLIGRLLTSSTPAFTVITHWMPIRMSIRDQSNSVKHRSTRKSTRAYHHKSKHFKTVRSKIIRQCIVLQKMAPKNASAVSKSLSKPTNGNRRKSNRVNPTPSQKEQENITQEQVGIMGSDKLADKLADMMDTTEDAEHNRMPQCFKEHLQQH